MSFRIHHQTPYYSQTAHDSIEKRSQEEWDAYKYCSAVKAGTLNGYCTLPGGQRLDMSNVGLARQRFGAFLSELLAGKGDAYLVPVPSKDSFDKPEFRSLAMLREALPNMQNRLLPIVRFAVKRTQASQGGQRGYDAVHPFLKVQPVVVKRRVVIIDDILTSGGSMLATRRRLVDAGHQVLFAVVCGRTTWTKLSAFSSGWEDAQESAKQVDLLAG